MDNPWLETIGMVDTVAHPDRPELRVLANPIRVDGKRLPNRAGPLLGADSEDILAEHGFDAQEIARFKSAGVI
jgi:crotonobetainyl-CoA:carnitine CoA-transferase CaiB-like acyl-CoA transferase